MGPENIFRIIHSPIYFMNKMRRKACKPHQTKKEKESKNHTETSFVINSMTKESKKNLISI